MADLSLQHIHKQYDNKGLEVVKDFNLDIKNGEFIVFVGPSGCGKSTTLRMIAGLEDITSGKLLINGQEMNNVLPKNRDIAMVFQNYALYPHMSVFDNIAFGLKIKRLPRKEIRSKVEEAANILGLEQFLKRKPKALSGGQRQRVALGRAIVRDASIFLMDEPLSNLDAKLRVQMRAEIIKLHNRLKTTTIYVTHDQTEALTMADRIVILNNGEIMQVGTPKEVYNYPNNLFVAQFIGSPPMNIFKCTFDGKAVHIGDNTILHLQDEQVELLNARNYKDQLLYFGIRPEDIKIQTRVDASKSSTQIETVVRVSELMGAEYMVYADLEGTDFAARVEADRNIEQGNRIYLNFNLNKTHFFDYNSKEKIV
ncbi:ABC transporter ATP-binding protein [Abyssicoccus albus]|uniref:Multiple sugar transport system ATP-binding protein n=1 Tax=Abyssicoccus albus TaxID=1817405 RepID=A0A3N5C6E0_9BACL|nr:sn-glycerol-3-phosphate ABC transporter ATP-binding protein UgpC [Abyssicoccus albus]RPF53855.1 multiple sugar transport system ATP-binding protein [Abyssicoccus albus]